MTQRYSHPLGAQVAVLRRYLISTKYSLSDEANDEAHKALNDILAVLKHHHARHLLTVEMMRRAMVDFQGTPVGIDFTSILPAKPLHYSNEQMSEVVAKLARTERDYAANASAHMTEAWARKLDEEHAGPCVCGYDHGDLDGNGLCVRCGGEPSK